MKKVKNWLIRGNFWLVETSNVYFDSNCLRKSGKFPIGGGDEALGGKSFPSSDSREIAAFNDNWHLAFNRTSVTCVAVEIYFPQPQRESFHLAIDKYKSNKSLPIVSLLPDC